MNEDITVDILNEKLKELFQLNKDSTRIIFKISKYKPRFWHVTFDSQLKYIEKEIVSYRERLQVIDNEILPRTFVGLNISTHVTSGRMSILLDTRNVVLNSIGEAQKQLSDAKSHIFFQITVVLSMLAISISFISFLYN